MYLPRFAALLLMLVMLLLASRVTSEQKKVDPSKQPLTMFCAPMPNGGPEIGSLMVISYQSAEKRKRLNTPDLGDSTMPPVQVSAASGFKSKVPPVKMSVSWETLLRHGLLTAANGPEADTA